MAKAKGSKRLHKKLPKISRKLWIPPKKRKKH